MYPGFEYARILSDGLRRGETRDLCKARIHVFDASVRVRDYDRSRVCSTAREN
jgi:hypothetical protein